MIGSDITLIILTGGEATRMRPLSLNKAKPMISFLGKPLLFNIVNSVKSAGFSNIIFSYKGKGVEKYFSDGKDVGVNITYRRKEINKWYGTAGVVRDIVEELGSQVSDPVMVIYGDSLLSVDYWKMLSFHQKKKTPVTILHHRPDFDSFLYEPQNLKLNEKRTNYGFRH